MAAPAIEAMAANPKRPATSVLVGPSATRPSSGRGSTMSTTPSVGLAMAAAFSKKASADAPSRSHRYVARAGEASSVARARAGVP